MRAAPLPSDLTGWRTIAYPYVLLTLASLFWAGNWVVGRAVRETMPPLALSFWHLVGIATILLGVWLATGARPPAG